VSPLAEVVPERGRSVQLDRVDLLDLHGPTAAPAGDAQQVPADVAEPLLPYQVDCGLGIGGGVVQDGLLVFGRISSPGPTSGDPGAFLPTAAVAASFCNLLSGRHAPACGAIGHDCLEHIMNIARRSDDPGGGRREIGTRPLIRTANAFHH
jgi:hypothetical protein